MIPKSIKSPNVPRARDGCFWKSLHSRGTGVTNLDITEQVSSFRLLVSRLDVKDPSTSLLLKLGMTWVCQALSFVDWFYRLSLTFFDLSHSYGSGVEKVLSELLCRCLGFAWQMQTCPFLCWDKASLLRFKGYHIWRALRLPQTFCHGFRLGCPDPAQDRRNSHP